MRLGFVTFVTFVLLIATAIFACGGDELPSVSDPPTQLQQATEPSAQQEDEEQPSSGQQTRPPEAGGSAESSTDSETDEVEKEPPPEDSSGDETAIQEPEREAGETRDAPLDAEVEDAEPESEEEPKDLTNVPAVVMEDADIHIRPGLPWRVIGRLSAGEEVAVLSAVGGWFRISFGDDREGWIRKPALDLGEIETWWILDAPAAAMVAEWQGEQYGVVGQSADGAEIRLLPMEDELAEIVSAPIDEVNLLADDITVHDLPIVIGDETVVFPGDDFRVGQGKILPKANEWMWLPSGWLLAHNDTHIWQWRPETDELEFTPRPPGPAKFSPDGRYLAVLTSFGDDREYLPFEDVIVFPLNGAPAMSLRQQFARSFDAPEMDAVLARSASDLQWSPNSEALAIRMLPKSWERYTYPALLMNIAGEVTMHLGLPEGVPAGFDCYLGSLHNRTDLLDWWWLRDDNTFAVYGLCAADEDDPREEFDVVFSLDGDYLGLEPFSNPFGDVEGAELVRSADEGEQLGQRLTLLWSPSEQYAVVIDREQTMIWLYDADGHQLRVVTLDTNRSDMARKWRLHLPRGLELEHWGHSIRWVIRWLNDNTAMVMPRIAYDDILAVLLLNVATNSTSVLELGSTAKWPCQETGSWRPDGQAFQVTVRGGLGYPYLWSGQRQMFQIMILDLEGSNTDVIHSVGSDWRAGPPHRAAWSPENEWFAIGRDQKPGLCVFGP